MEQYISKSALIAEIESLKRTTFTNFDEGVNATVQTLLEIVDTLEVKEADLDAEFDKYCETLYLIDLENEPYAELFECAKYFFELGLKAQKGE